jgi:Zn-dependent M32 family carboxypeptidase
MISNPEKNIITIDTQTNADLNQHSGKEDMISNFQQEKINDSNSEQLESLPKQDDLRESENKDKERYTFSMLDPLEDTSDLKKRSGFEKRDIIYKGLNLKLTASDDGGKNDSVVLKSEVEKVRSYSNEASPLLKNQNNSKINELLNKYSKQETSKIVDRIFQESKKPSEIVNFHDSLKLSESQEININDKQKNSSENAPFGLYIFNVI